MQHGNRPAFAKCTNQLAAPNARHDGVGEDEVDSPGKAAAAECLDAIRCRDHRVALLLEDPPRQPRSWSESSTKRIVSVPTTPDRWSGALRRHQRQRLQRNVDVKRRPESKTDSTAKNPFDCATIPNTVERPRPAPNLLRREERLEDS
jgi:hypothetical protein